MAKMVNVGEVEVGDKVLVRCYGMRKEGDKLFVGDERQIPSFFKGEYEIDPTIGYELKEGYIKDICDNSAIYGYSFDGDCIVVHCDEKTKDGIGIDRVVPKEWIEE